jgi:hypothetical protein
VPKPRFTDLHRFHDKGYVPANATDIRETFERARKRLRLEPKPRARVVAIKPKKASAE